MIVNAPISAELALGIALALESTESDIERARELVRETESASTEGRLAEQLLARAQRRLEKVRDALSSFDERARP